MTPDPHPTHDWSRQVDVDHLAAVRAEPARYAPGGAFHLLLEVLAYAAEEAAATAGPAGPTPSRCRVILHPDGSVSVADTGRGTQTRVAEGPPVRKPVAATPDLRLFDREPPELLPDGLPRRGLSVVSALSADLVHLNRRTTGAWRQRYERGVPVTDLEPVEPDGTTGTTVTFRPDPTLAPLPPRDDAAWRLLGTWPHLTVLREDRRGDGATGVPSTDG